MSPPKRQEKDVSRSDVSWKSRGNNSQHTMPFLRRKCVSQRLEGEILSSPNLVSRDVATEAFDSSPAIFIPITSTSALLSRCI